jgi:hypothetical protein
MPHAQTRRHFLHDRSQLIRTSPSGLPVEVHKAGAASAGFVVFQTQSLRLSLNHAQCGQRKLLVKNLRLGFPAMNDRPRRTTAGDMGRQSENGTEATLGL